jgi:mono/diheme cytochrome c family protein
MSRSVIALLVLLGTLGCEKPEFAPPDRAERVTEADALFDAAMFDTIQWASDELRLAHGNEVYLVHCRRCHGPFGTGDTPYARDQRLNVPSLIEPDWPFADDFDAVRRRVFTGHPAGMPTLGVSAVSPRDIDAVAYYVMYRLRSDANGAAPDGR